MAFLLSKLISNSLCRRENFPPYPQYHLLRLPPSRASIDETLPIGCIVTKGLNSVN